MDEAMRLKCERSSVRYGGEVLWARCLTCAAPLLNPSRKCAGLCRNQLACFLRYHRNKIRAAVTGRLL